MTAYPKPIKTVKKKKRVKNERSRLEKKLDDLVSLICRKKGSCEICGKSDGVLNAHHFKSRRLHGLRWYLPNLICLCVHHHVFNHEFSAHKTPEAFRKRMIEIRGQKWIEDIDRRAIGHGRFKMFDLEFLYEQLKKEELQATLEALNGERATF